MIHRPIFITGNQDKIDHLSRLLGIPLDHRKLELDELQSTDANALIEHKARQAYELVQQSVLVDDASMWFDELGGLPGPFIKYFVNAPNGLENLCRMVDGLASRRATAQVHFGVFDGKAMHVLHGEIHGDIADHPRGERGFAYGWDTIFCPDGYDGRTRGELNETEYEDVYRQIRPIQQLQVLLGDDG